MLMKTPIRIKIAILTLVIVLFNGSNSQDKPAVPSHSAGGGDNHLGITITISPPKDRNSKYVSGNKDSLLCRNRERCVALLAYGLLSYDMHDVPLGGTCKGFLSDSVITYLQQQKRIAHARRYKKIKLDTNELQINWDFKEVHHPCQIPEKCAAQIAKILLLDDVNDIAKETACDGFLQDSLMAYLQLQKQKFYNWIYHKRESGIGVKLYGGRHGKNGIDLLYALINTRISMETGTAGITWLNNVNYLGDMYGDNYSFIWRQHMLGAACCDLASIIYNSVKLDFLGRRNNFNDYAAYLDTNLVDEYRSISTWCETVTYSADRLRKYSKNDFLLRYYDSRCRK